MLALSLVFVNFYACESFAFAKPMNFKPGMPVIAIKHPFFGCQRNVFCEPHPFFKHQFFLMPASLQFAKHTSYANSQTTKLNEVEPVNAVR